MAHGQDHALLRILLVVTPVRIGIRVRGEIGRIILPVRLSLVHSFVLRARRSIFISLVFTLLLPLHVSQPPEFELVPFGWEDRRTVLGTKARSWQISLRGQIAPVDILEQLANHIE